MRLTTATNQFIEAGGMRLAFRALGPSTGTPLICLQHFTGTMDSWDPVVIDGLASSRPVFVFDNAGVGPSEGETPDNVEQMATDAVAFITTLGFDQVDLLGFSLGGMVAQAIAEQHAALLRKIILVGTAPRGGLERLLVSLKEAIAHPDAPDPRLPLFFTDAPVSWDAGLAFLARAAVRTQNRDPESGEAIRTQHAKAIIGWCGSPDVGHAKLSAIDKPTLVVSGSHDRMLPEENAMTIFRAMRNAQLVMYPESGHGSLFQYPERFIGHVNQFLSE